MLKSKIKCPYCNEILQDPPKTKKKCPNCRNPVYFKVDPYTNKKYYLTEKDVDKIDKLIDRYRVEERFYNRFNEYGLTERYFKKRREKYDKKAKGNYSAFSFITSIFNEMNLGFAKSNDFQTLSGMYFSMAYFLFDYNIDFGHSHNFFPYLHESKKMELLHLKRLEKTSGFKHKVQILTSGKGSACTKCYALEGKAFTIDEALKKMPIPVKYCDNGFCRCTYVMMTV